MPKNKSTRKGEAALKVVGLHKSFKIPLEKGNNLKQRVVHFNKKAKGYREISPLNGIDFEVKKGEFFGIVGRNGSGKSTLLKTMAGIYEPNSGHVTVNGSLVPFIELGVGFNPELTGRENVFLNGALLGFSRSEMEGMYRDIVDFAELEDFMDERLKNYSSGMQVRLAFSIAIRAKGDILLLDEVLAVGDSAFQQKCYSYFYDLKEQNRTVILVTHSMSAVERYCTRAMLISDGEIKLIGDPEDVAHAYEMEFIDDKSKESNGSRAQERSADVTVEAVVMQNGKPTDTITAQEDFVIRIKLTANADIHSGNIGINLRDENRKVVFSADSRHTIGEIRLKKGKQITVNFKILNQYTNGNYRLDVHVVDESKQTDAVLYVEKNMKKIRSIGFIYHPHSLFHPKYHVVVSE